MNGADVFIGVSGPHCVTKEMVKSMAHFGIYRRRPYVQRAAEKPGEHQYVVYLVRIFRRTGTE